MRRVASCKVEVEQIKDEVASESQHDHSNATHVYSEWKGLWGWQSKLQCKQSYKQKPNNRYRKTHEIYWLKQKNPAILPSCAVEWNHVAQPCHRVAEPKHHKDISKGSKGTPFNNVLGRRVAYYFGPELEQHCRR